MALGVGPIAPGPIDLDATGNIFTWDFDAQKLLKLDSSGPPYTQFGSYGSGASDDLPHGPTDIAVSPDGLTVFILDAQANGVKKVMLIGTPSLPAAYGGNPGKTSSTKLVR